MLAGCSTKLARTIERMSTPDPSDVLPWNETDLAALEHLLDAVPAPLEPLDLMMLDGFLAGVLLQPKLVPDSDWLPHVTDLDGRPLPANYPLGELRPLLLRRHSELNRAIHRRVWIDPWIFELDDEADPLETVMPWVAGFATAMDLFPGVMNQPGAEALEPLALLYRAFDPDDLEDADELLEVIEELEPPQDLEEAVEDLVTALFRLADVTRPRSPVKPAASGRPGPGGRAGGSGGGGSRGGPAGRGPGGGSRGAGGGQGPGPGKGSGGARSGAGGGSLGHGGGRPGGAAPRGAAAGAAPKPRQPKTR